MRYNTDYKGLIFDLDGTLVDSLEDVADSMNYVLSNNHFPIHALNAYKSFIGNGILNLVRVALPEFVQDDKIVRTCYSEMFELYRDNCTTKTRPYEGIVDMLNELKKRKMKLSVFSNKTDELTKKIVHELLPDYFEIIAGYTKETLKKPNPDIVLQICGEFGINPENMIYVGDTAIDMMTAQNANMTGIGVHWGFRSSKELIDNGAIGVLYHPMDLIEFL